MLETQEALSGRDREKLLRSEMSRLQSELEKERQKSKAVYEKVREESSKSITNPSLRRRRDSR